MTIMNRPCRWIFWLALIGGLTVFWYGVGVILAGTGRVLVWDDQTSLFLRMVDHLAAPNRVDAFKNPPWAALLLAPFGLIARYSTPLALLVQLFLYWFGLALLVHKFSDESQRSLRAYLIALTSPFALDAALNLNIDWIVVFGLLLPAAYSGPLLLVKPQNAIGYLFTFSWKTLMRWVLVTLIVVLASFIIWGAWPLIWLENTSVRPVGTNVNFAPWYIISPLVTIPVGIVLGIIARRRGDPALGILAGAFLVPYIAFYTMLLHFTLIAVRWPRAALIISLALWVVIGVFIAN
ncbi:MAG: hypothetical protein NZM00_11755 [Anaerolinea sp.]|nr:hypothetical protein [Anaerolinea sp.]